MSSKPKSKGDGASDRDRVISKDKKGKNKLPVLVGGAARFSALSKEYVNAAAARMLAKMKTDMKSSPSSQGGKNPSVLTSGLQKSSSSKSALSMLASTSLSTGKTNKDQKSKNETESSKNSEKNDDKNGDGEEKRLTLWNKVRLCKVSGGGAPFPKDLAVYLSTRPDYELYVGQDTGEMMGGLGLYYM